MPDAEVWFPDDREPKGGDGMAVVLIPAAEVWMPVREAEGGGGVPAVPIPGADACIPGVSRRAVCGVPAIPIPEVSDWSPGIPEVGGGGGAITAVAPSPV